MHIKIGVLCSLIFLLVSFCYVLKCHLVLGLAPGVREDGIPQNAVVMEFPDLIVMKIYHTNDVTMSLKLPRCTVCCPN